MNRSICHQLLSQCKTLRELQKIHAKALVHGLHPAQQSVSCKIFRCYADFGCPSDARELFDEVPSPDLVSFTSLMSLHIQLHSYIATVKLYLCSHMLQPLVTVLMASLLSVPSRPLVGRPTWVSGRLCMDSFSDIG
jgi:hypothetical protein